MDIDKDVEEFDRETEELFDSIENITSLVDSLINRGILRYPTDEELRYLKSVGEIHKDELKDALKSINGITYIQTKVYEDIVRVFGTGSSANIEDIQEFLNRMPENSIFDISPDDGELFVVLEKNNSPVILEKNEVLIQ